MSIAKTDDGVNLHYEITGSGTPIIFVHEFAGDMRSWEGQVRHFGRWYSCVTFNARGYPPSDVPADPNMYSQARAVEDVIAVMDHAGIDRAHIVGLSMGGFAVLHLGLSYPDRVRSLCVAGAGYGAEPGRKTLFQKESESTAAFLSANSMEAFAAKYSVGPARLPFKASDPRGFAEFQQQLAEQSALGLANTQLGVQRLRPSLYDLKDDLANLTVPTLILNGDEDTSCLEPGLMLKAAIPSAALSVVPNCGHTINLEAADDFNRIVGEFIVQAESGRWPVRRSTNRSDTITGMVL
ncbi:alpha/beta hydrolase [Paraburkholderia fungorum]|uniref:alpha/beta fold hydrolase n=1 Tax=Paraburkholderia fungorum TaxID=134537 RepID=UPI0038B8ADA2